MTEMKFWDQMTDAEKEDIQFLKQQKKLYESKIDKYKSFDDYKDICAAIKQLEKVLLKEHEKIEKSIQIEEKKKQNQSIREQNDADIKQLIEDHDFRMSGKGKLVWYYLPEHKDEYGCRHYFMIEEATLKANFPVLNLYISAYGGEPEYHAFRNFTRFLKEDGRTYIRIVEDYTTPTTTGVLNLMNKEFCKPAEDGSTDYHWLFDALFESLSGQEENDADDENLFVHLQKILLSKYQQPDNPFLPSILLNDDGATGKGLFTQMFLPRLFSGKVASNCAIEHLTGKFNATIAGKAIVALNETARDKVDNEKLKAFLGSPKFMVERKFQEPYETANTALIVCSSNESSAAFQLSGTNTDRRYSIFSSKTDIYRTAIKYMQRYENQVFDVPQMTKWINENAKSILHDEQQVGKWINAMCKKYGVVGHVMPIRGEVYKASLEEQRSYWLKTVESVFTDPGFTYIRAQVLRDMVENYNKGEFIHKRKNAILEIKRLIQEKGWAIEYKERCNIYDPDGAMIQRTVWRKIGCEKLYQNDEVKYCHKNQNGMIVWNYEI